MKCNLELRTTIAAALLLGFLSLIGCNRTVTLYPISKSDIFYVEQGTVIGQITTEKPGYFLSEFYLSEIAKAKVE